MNRAISVSISDVMGKTWSFDNLRALRAFLADEVGFWSKRKEGISNPHEYFAQRGLLQETVRAIDNWKTQISDWDDGRLSVEVNNLRNSQLNNFRSYWLWSGHDFVNAWIEACKISTETGTAFLEYIQNKTVRNISVNKNWFNGYMLAYEFGMQGESAISKRRSSEKASFSQLRDRLDKSANELIKEVDEFKNDFEQWHTETKEAQQSEFDALQQQRNDTFELDLANWTNKISELETTYEEALRLKKPAQYWKNKAKEYKAHGDKWAKCLFSLLGVGFIVFAILFSCWLFGKDVALDLKSLQGAIIFATVLTIYAIAIQSISKMVFSSYHLQRDAEEREQLAYVYLALTNEQGHIDEDSRKIVLQALFSRADTGLLKDSSPTMPGGMAELMKNLGGKN
ncbi:MAG: DUF6161 domain-containing protein [Campylobacterales bacterium]|nr:DUF6161 domain-containing protein [Campylobacterales bacterium]